MVRWSIQISQQRFHFHQRIIYIKKALQGQKIICFCSWNSQMNVQLREIQNYISSCVSDMCPCEFFHSLQSSLCSNLMTWEIRGVTGKYFLLKKTLEETCFPDFWIKATLGWYGNDKNSSLTYPSGVCYLWHWCWDHIAELKDFSVLGRFWSCLAGHVCVLLLLSLWREHELWDTVSDSKWQQF